MTGLEDLQCAFDCQSRILTSTKYLFIVSFEHAWEHVIVLHCLIEMYHFCLSLLHHQPCDWVGL